MSLTLSSYDPKSGIYSYKKDGTWFFSFCPPEDVASKRVDGKWYFLDNCGGGGDGSAPNLAPYAKTTYVDSQDQKIQANVDKCFSDSKDYADSIVADYALVSYVDEQIAAIEIPEDQDLSLYAKTTDVTSGDAATLKDSKDYTDAAVAAIEIPEGGSVDLSSYSTTAEMISADATTLADAKAYTDQGIAAIPPVDLSGYATKKESTDGDVKSLDDSKKYTDQKIGSIVFPPGTTVSGTEPENVPNGTNWFDTVRLELFVRASDSWLPSSPLGSRVSQGEIVQSQILDRIDGLTTTEYVDGADQAVQRFATTADEAVLNAARKYTDDSLGTIPDASSDVDKAYVDAQDATKIGNTGEQILPASAWKLRAKKVDNSGNYSYISIQDDTLRLYHVADPTADAHGMSRGFADARYQFIQRQIVFKCDQYVKCTTSPSPAPGEFCGLNNSSPGSATSPNPYFGNWNVGIRVDSAKLLNPEGNQLSDMERYTFEGTVTVLDNTGKLYFKASAHSVSRTNSNSYVDINFGSRVPAFGTGSYNDSERYIILVEGLETIEPSTVNIQEGTE